MRLLNITATPHPGGNRIDLSWENPRPADYPGVMVRRREGTHPVKPTDGALVVQGEGLTSARDEGLQGETIYYYSLFPYRGDPPVYSIDPHNRAAAMATAPYDLAGQMYELLPGIYHRYDTALPAGHHSGVAEEDKIKGQLRRLLDLPGSQLDLIYSFAKAMLDFRHIDKVDGRLLPLLAQWIGWQSDFSRELDQQRNEIRNAPFIYQRVGLIPTVEATVKRVTGWQGRTKEFVHNVFRSNQPERFNLWMRRREETGDWPETGELLSLDYAYEGRPSAVEDAEGVRWLFYHTPRNNKWQIWFKTYTEEGGWSPSQRLAHTGDTDKHPTAANHNGELWVFWNTYSETSSKWRINYRTRAGGKWSEIHPFAHPLNEDDENLPERRQPVAITDNAGGLWLFWLEKANQRWQLKYNRHDGTGWQLDPPADFPAEASGADPRPLNDLYAFFHPGQADQPIWLFWARKEPSGEPDQTRWRIFYRVKESLDPALSDWSAVRALPEGVADSHDREPAVFLNPNGDLEIYWSSNRADSRAIWLNTLDPATHAWSAAPAKIGLSPYSHCAPLLFSAGGNTFLVYRSNESLTYTSEVYRATQTVDARYAGSTTFDTRNTAKKELFEKFEDFQTYTYDSGQAGRRTDEDRYARDTIGIFLTPGTGDEARQRDIIRKTLPAFLPIQVRAALIMEEENVE